jgi:thymidine phosphorylase
VPAATRLAALADVTAAGRIPSLIAASVTARALALGTPVACVHVTYGDAALVPDHEGAREVAATAEAFGRAWGRRIVCVLTEMSTPLAPALGHRLLVHEAARVLRGGGSPALRSAALDVVAAVASASGLEGDAREGAGRALADGRAKAAAVAWGERHGVASDVLTGATATGLAPQVREVAAGRDGVVGIASVLRLGEAVRRLGAGRLHADQAVDGGVGVAFTVPPGEQAEAGETVVHVYGRDAYLTDRAAEEVSAQVTVGDA